MADDAAPAGEADDSGSPERGPGAPKPRSRHALPKDMQSRRSWRPRRSKTIDPVGEAVGADEDPDAVGLPADDEAAALDADGELDADEESDAAVLEAAESDDEPEAAALVVGDDNDDDEEAAHSGGEEPADKRQKAARRPRSALAKTAITFLLIALALGGVAGYLGYVRYQEHVAQQQRDRFLAVGEQVAVDLTSVRFDSAEADLQRILDHATDNLYNDLSKRTGTFPEVARANQGIASGKVISAGVESIDDTRAQVLVAVNVVWTNQTLPQEKTDPWRMRVMLREVAPGDVKASRVEFVQ